ncbi:alpha/beta hydrolase [Agrobacterium sp. a22-2]|uniref:alpha/beta fold hydrolase n=1 Tax=Agrobacterium sp. a22-2 TaxID=2283840 RepID=UPI001446755C|nr:alpha/beta hydrolase [Agrobacterium sp. a22-2]NKN35521.1 alpha/beta hydrolase [Agrobacterium sp. a22-2]
MLFPLLAIAALIGCAGVFSSIQSRKIESRYPNIGELTDIGGMRMNALHIPAGDQADLPPLVFIHGASGNLRDQATAFRDSLEGRAELVFVDRPGHGYSERGGPENATPDGQAAAIARLMDKKGIDRAIIIGHSFGASIAASFAVLYPEKTAGLLFLAPATHPWPGGVDWYYDVTSTPVIGPLFARTLAMPAGLMRLEAAIGSVFGPNPAPADYIDKTGPALVLRPESFRNNALDVAGLHAYVTRMAPRYREIAAPTVIITGDSDDVVLEEIHSRGLERDIAGSELVWIRGLGHKPDYIATDIAVAALEKIAGRDRDLQAMARTLEIRLRQQAQ